MKKKMYPYIQRKKRMKQSKVNKRILQIQSSTHKNRQPSNPLTSIISKKEGKQRPRWIPSHKNRWKLTTSVCILTLGIVILLLPTMIVIPFMDARSEEKVAEDPMKEMLALEVEDDSSLTVPVMRAQTEEIEDVPLETYVARVIASEMPAEFEMEALKAQGVAARTYIIDLLMHHGEETDAFISDQTDDQVYSNDEELREKWGSDYTWKMDKLLEAVTATEGEVITYNQMTITPAYFSTSNGYTVNSEDYWENELPYLRKVESKWDEESPSFLDQQTFTKGEIEQLLAISLPSTNEVPIQMTHTESNRVDELIIANETFTGREVREKLGLKSSDFTIEQKSNHFVFNTKGFGHGIGMSQYGANGMAKEGKTYEEILSYYYQGVEVQIVDDIAPMLVQK